MKFKTKVIGGLSLIITIIAIPIGILTPEVRTFLGLEQLETREIKSEKDNFEQNQAFGEFVDERDDNLYRWIRIGNQIWMADNLAYIPAGTCGFELWLNGYNDSFENKRYCIYNNEDKYLENYGVMYTWNTVELEGECSICPKGWHVSTDEDWKQLELSIGMNKSIVDKIQYRGNNWKKRIKRPPHADLK